MFRSADPTAAPAELQSLTKTVADWPRALQLGEREGATPAVWAAFRHDPAALPAEAVTFLRARTMMSDFRMLRLSARLSETVSVFRERGIPVLLLKGAAVGALSDPSFRARPMSDVDLLVDPADAPRAREAILAAGWHQTEDQRLHTLLKDMHHEAPFHDASLPGLRLELHSRLLPPDLSFPFSATDLWRDAVAADHPFHGASVPSLEHLFVHAAIHFAWQHQLSFGAWRSIRTVAFLINTPDFAWESTLEEVRRAKAVTSCYWTLRLAQRLAGLAIPPGVLDGCAPPTSPVIRNAIERASVVGIAPGEAPSNPSDFLAGLLWRAALRPKWSGLGRPRRGDPDHVWERTMGTFQEERWPARLRRHARSSRAWWDFLSRTLTGR